MRATLWDLLALVGFAAIVYGTWLYAPPLAFLVVPMVDGGPRIGHQHSAGVEGGRQRRRQVHEVERALQLFQRLIGPAEHQIEHAVQAERARIFQHALIVEPRQSLERLEIARARQAAAGEVLR